MFTAGAHPALTSFLAAPVNLDRPGHYLHWGVIQLSVANLVVIAVMLALFALAVLLPFPGGRGRR
ncbi:MAG: hypothetical protein QOF18_2458 [Frankiaceae bacterium]|jgi:hypothetical protein|nr:hypothetical protein [Frankiaceae bacterium]